MINVEDVLRDLPHFETFCSVEKLHALVERLRPDSRFTIEVAGTSVNGLPIHHVRFGSESVKALVVGGPHAHEPISSLTVFSLLSLLSEGNPALLDADVEWHIVPCIDPDGAILNEGWTQQPFTLESYLRNFHLQARPEQVDISFPIVHKQLVFDRPSQEAKVLQRILDQVQPDFYFSLHNFQPMGGTWFALSNDIGQGCYRQLNDLLQQHRITLQTKTAPSLLQFAPGMSELSTVRKHYDHLEQNGVAIPEEFRQGKLGAASYDYLLEIKPNALVFVVELPYGQHPGDVSEQETGQNLRQLNLRMSADNKYLATVILEEWENVEKDLNVTSPFYRKIRDELVAVRDTLYEGVTAWYERPIQYLLFNPTDRKIATERDRIVAYGVYGTAFLGNARAFVRLLEVSKQTPAVRQATERMERVFDEALADLGKAIDLDQFKVIDCDTLAKVQLGSGLIALNSLLAA